MQTPGETFVGFPKMPRLQRDIVITEKIDGTNGLIYIPEGTFEEPRIHAGSRNRWLTPEKDNYGFARWVEENAETLIHDLGPGRHFGEWWGQGIQRRYGLDHKRFSLFNTKRWFKTDESDIPACARFVTPNLGVVPILYEGPFQGYSWMGSTTPWGDALLILASGGSVAAPGFKNPEGIVVFHTRAGQAFKVTLGDDGAKGNG